MAESNKVGAGYWKINIASNFFALEYRIPLKEQI